MIRDELAKLWAFLKRDFYLMWSYKMVFSTTFLNILFNFFYLVLFGSMFVEKVPSQIAVYHGNFISYLLVGTIGWSFLWSIMGTTSSAIRSEMLRGTLESIFLTPTRLSTMIVAYAIFGSIFGFISIILLLIFAYFLFGISVFLNASLGTLLIFFLSALMMFGFGMIFSGLTIWIKNIGQIIPLIQSITMFFSGVYFPVDVLPAYLRPISKFIPFYYSIEGLRLSLIPSYAILQKYIITLFILSVLSVLAGLYTIHLGELKAKKEGTLSLY